MAKNNKKYQRITNWDKYNIPGLKVSRNNMYRLFCGKCYTTTYVHANTCPCCGNTEFKSNSNQEHEYRILDIKSGLIAHDFVSYSIDYNDSEQTQIKRHVRTETLPLNRFDRSLDEVYDALPELMNDHRYKLAYDIMMSFEGTSPSELARWGRNYAWRNTVAFAEKLCKEKPNADLEDVKDIMSVIGQSAKTDRLGLMASKNVSILGLYQDFLKLEPFMLNLANDYNVFCRLVDNPRRYNHIDAPLRDFISGYYGAGHLSNVVTLLDYLESVTIDSNCSYWIQKFLKEKYADSGYAYSEVKNFVSWLQRGNRCVNIKDYYMQLNADIFLAAYSKSDYEKAMEDFYNHPAEALIKLSQLK